MLPPFRVRNFRRPKSSERSRPVKPNFDALVRISARDYDNTVRAYPKASLKYLDEEDGEVVTVGSSFELLQCLETPLRESPPHFGSLSRSWRMSGMFNSSETLPDPAAYHPHVFNVEDGPSSLQIWREIEQRSKEALRTYNFLHESDTDSSFATVHDLRFPYQPGPSQCPRVTASGPATRPMMHEKLSEYDLKVHVDTSDDVSRLQELEAYRIASREAGNPVQLTQSRNSQMSKNLYEYDLKVHVDASDDLSRLQELEDYRIAYFNESNPRQLKRLSIPALGHTIDIEKDSESARMLMEKSIMPIAAAYPSCNLTLEGKRQAQAAGDKLRQRITCSCCERLSSLIDPAGDQNRWASFNESTSPFHPENLTGFTQLSTGPKLGLDGKRQQSQEAGDKLRSRMNSLPHSKSLRGWHNHGVNKHHHSLSSALGSVSCSNRREHSVTEVKVLEAGRAETNDRKQSLLNLFEAELARVPSRLTQAQDKVTTGNHINANVLPIFSAAASQNTANQPTPDTRTPLDQIGLEACIEMLELGLRAALSSFDTCVHNIMNSVQTASAAVQSTDKTRIDNAIASFCSLTSGIAASGEALRKGLVSKRDFPDPRRVSSVKDEIDQQATSLPGDDTDRKAFSLPKNEGYEKLCKSAGGSNEQTEAESSTVKNRFPILEETEGTKPEPANTFPPLPCMEALIPRRSTCAQQPDTNQSMSLQSLVASATLRSDTDPNCVRRLKINDSVPITSDHKMVLSKSDESLQLAAISDTDESSEEFFNRMTSLGHNCVTSSRSTPNSLTEQGSAGPDAPVVEDESSLATQSEHGTPCSHLQSVFVDGLDDRCVRNSRRPYSQNFSGEGRIAWDSFLRGRPLAEPMKFQGNDDPMLIATVVNPGVDPMMAGPVINQEPKPTLNVLKSSPKDGEVNKSATGSHVRYNSEGNDRSDAASVMKARECVAQLYDLGFGDNATEGGMARLVIYAQAANGDLVGAIDMIDEERRAYKQMLQR